MNAVERLIQARCPDVDLRGGDEVIGYWARYCGVPFEDLDNKAQRTGWKECDRELKSEAKGKAP